MCSLEPGSSTSGSPLRSLARAQDGSYKEIYFATCLLLHKIGSNQSVHHDENI